MALNLAKDSALSPQTSFDKLEMIVRAFTCSTSRRFWKIPVHVRQGFIYCPPHRKH